MSTLLWASPLMLELYGLPSFTNTPVDGWQALMEPLGDWTWCEAHFTDEHAVGTFVDPLACTRSAHNDGIHIASGGAGEIIYLVWTDEPQDVVVEEEGDHKAEKK